MQVKLVPVEKIIPYASNPRKNAGIPVAKVKASLKEFGWRQPIVVDSEGVIVVGHTRYQAALELGMTEIPVHVAEGLTAAQVKAYRIADNKTGDFAEWDFDMLKLEFADLQDLDFSLDMTGFDGDAIEQLCGEIGIEHGGSDHSGASPWDRMNKDASDGVLVSIGEITCRISQESYELLINDRPQSDVARWIEGIIYASCGRN